MRYGWRARVGHVSPAIVDTQAEECRKLLPPGVLHQVLSVSEPVQALTPDQLARAGGLMVEAARRLAAEEADVIVAGGAPASAGRGPAADDELIAAMREATRLPCTTANRAVVEDIGADRLLYGTNFGGADSHEGDLTDGLGLSDADREKIRSGNTLELIKF